MKKKKVDTKKLDSISEHSIYKGNPTIFWHNVNIIFKDKIERKFDRAEVVLLSNSSWNLKYCIETAKYFLNLSLKENAEKLTSRKPDDFENNDIYEDHIRAIEHKFLLPSIIFYNSSFDYLYIFVFPLLTGRKEIVESGETKKDKVEKEMRRLRLSNKKYSWMFALNSLITQNSDIRKRLKGEEELKQVFVDDFIKLLNELKTKNEELKKNYYANIIKHQQIPFFKPKRLNNVGGAQNSIDINKFYSLDEIIPSVIHMIPEIVLDIEKTQNFLIQYHNITVKAFNYLLDKIYIG